MEKPFLLLAKSAQAQQTIKKSIFIAYVSPATSKTAALKFIEAIKQLHPKARHHCYAFLIGEQDQIQRESDNGEPAGTAGVPILEVLKMEQLHNVVAVVVRYFGGIKLGTGGLIRAYNSTTSLAITAAGICQRVKVSQFKLLIDYRQLAILQHFLAQQQIKINQITYKENITLSFSAPVSQAKQLKKAIINLLNARLTLTISDDGFEKIPYQSEK